jgi:CRISPR-associated protein Csx17
VLLLHAAKSPKLRESLLFPPPRLSEEWATAADDESLEFGLAEALGSLDAETDDFRLPFRRHLVPLDCFSHRRDEWGTGTEAQVLAVWRGRDPIRDMASVLERRLIESQRRTFVAQGQAELPLHGGCSAPLAAVAAFLSGNTDDRRIGALTAGLAWTKPRRKTSFPMTREDPLPFAYRVLKPLFAPEGVGSVQEEKRRVDPLPLLRQVRAGRLRDAVQSAQAMARGAGLAAPFARQPSIPMGTTERLAAALLFPLAKADYQFLIDRVYPELSKEGKEYEIHVD